MSEYRQWIEDAKETLDYQVETVSDDFTRQVTKHMSAQGITRMDLAEPLKMGPDSVRKLFSMTLSLRSMIRVARALGKKVDVRLVDP